jgi:hypothetical protein
MTALLDAPAAPADSRDLPAGTLARLFPTPEPEHEPNRAERRRVSRERARDLRRLMRDFGYRDDHYAPELVRELAGPAIAGGATGQGGVAFLSNLPPDRFRMDPALFEQSTERQDIPQPAQPFNGFGSSSSVRLQNVGVVAMVRLMFVGSLVVAGAGTVTSQPGWPYNLLGRVAFNANGQTSLLQVRGTTLRVRRQRIFRNPPDTLQSAVGVPTGVIANGTYPVQFVVDVPVAHDFYTGIGWVLAQNPSTSLSVDVAYAAVADCLTLAGGSTATLTGTLNSTLTTFAVGQAMAGNQAVTVIPDLTVFHGLLDNTAPIASSGTIQAPLIRTAGQLLNYGFNLRNGTAAEIAPSALTELQFRYGGNRQPRVYNPPGILIEKNQADYNGLTVVNGLTYTWLDFEVDNPVRDLFLPEALVELTAQFTIPAAVTVNAGAQVLYVEETLYPAV